MAEEQSEDQQHRTMASPAEKSSRPTSAAANSSPEDKEIESLPSAAANSTAEEKEAESPPVGAPLEPSTTGGSQRKGLEERSKSKVVLIMAALAMATFLAALDATIIAVALPVIAEDLTITEAEYTWIGSAYTLGCAAATPPWGKISDIFGRKPILLIANVVFFVGSLICATSQSVNVLIAGRTIQGIGGGGLLSLVNICIADLVSMRNRGVYYGIIGGVWAIAGGIGPILGGIFTAYATWRWCFYVNLPCDGAAFLVLLFFLDIETPKTPLIEGLKAIDWLGTILIVGAVVMFLIGLETGGVSLPWSSPTVICLLVFGFITFVIFFLVEWKVAKYPIVPLRLFKRRSAAAAFYTCFSHGMTFIAGSYFLPLYFQAVIGSSPLMSGVDQLAFVGGIGISSIAVGPIIRKTGHYQEPIWLGMFLLTVGIGLFIDLPSTANWGMIIPFEIIAGLGAGPNFQAPLLAMQNNIAPRDMATGTAAFAFTRNMASSLGLVIGGVIFQNRINDQANTLSAVLPPNLVQLLGSGSAGASVGVIAKLPPQARDVVRQIYTRSLSDMWAFFTGIAGLGFFVSLLIRKKELSKEHQVRRQGLEQQEADRLEELNSKEKKRNDPER